MKSKRNLAITIGLLTFLAIAGSTALAQFRGSRFGAIAYSQSNGRFGSSWGFSFEAEERALSACNRTDCRPVLWFRNGCGALARARNGAYVTAWSSSMYEARRLVSNHCTREWGSCKLICSVCSAGNEP
jgi:Domain of unknown function (DUF4189)